MNILVVMGIIFVVLAIALFVLRKIKGLVFSIVGALVLMVGFFIFVLVNPANPVSMWVTSNIAQNTVLDEDNEYSAGDIIWSQIISREELTSKEKSHAQSAISAAEKDKLDHLVSFIESRVTDVIVQHLDEDTFLKTYSLEFKDALLSVSSNLSSVTITITKI